MQTTLVAGETLNYLASVPEYPATAGWALTLYLNRRAGGTAVNYGSTASGEQHLLQVPGSTTADWTPGAYGWEIWAVYGAERYRVSQGQIEVEASLIGAAAGADTRSAAVQARDALRAAWQAYISSGNITAASYSIGGRSMTFRTVAELRAALNAAERDVLAEEQADRIAAGLGGRQRFVVRM